MATQIRYTYRFSVHALPDEAVDPFNARDFQPPGEGWALFDMELLATERKAVVLWQKCVEVEGDDG
jgi:hypothetical protein